MRRRLAVALFLAVFGIVALSAGGHTSSSDEETMLATTRALLHGHVALTLTPGNENLLAVRASPNGEVGIPGIGQSIAIAPTYLIGVAVARLFPARSTDLIERLFADFTGAWIAGLLAVLIFFVALELGASLRASAALALTSIIATGLWPEAKTMFSEPLTALLIMMSVLYALRATATGSSRAALLSGLALGAAPLARSTSVLFALPVGVYVIAMAWRAGFPRRAFLSVVGSFIGGTGVTLALLLLSNWWRFGSPFDNGYPPQPFDTPLLTGLFGLFLSPGKSLFLYAPLALVAVLAIPIAMRRHAAETVLLLAIFVVTLPIYATFHDWHGDNAWGPRYLYSTLPVLLVILAPALSRVRWRRAFAVAALVGVVVNLSAVLVYFNDYISWVGDRTSPAGLARDATGEFIYYDDMHFQPQWSPVIGEWRLVPSAVKLSALEIVGRTHAIPAFTGTTSSKFGWYFKPIQLDLWWYLAVPTGTPLALELLVPIFIGAAGVGLYRLYPLLISGSRGIATAPMVDQDAEGRTRPVRTSSKSSS